MTGNCVTRVAQHVLDSSDQLGFHRMIAQHADTHSDLHRLRLAPLRAFPETRLVEQQQIGATRNFQ